MVHDLAGMCGLDIPEAKVERFSKNGSTFLVKRFDRNGTSRVHFVSAMTLLGREDGDVGSYLDLVALIRSYSVSPDDDLRELWRRLIFNISVSDTDDHLRNHGFILTDRGWRLSPVYDVNPVPYGDRLSLDVSEGDNLASIELALTTTGYYGLSDSEAESVAQDICSKIRDNWQQLAKKHGVSRAEIEMMRPAFEKEK